jgi:uncharacterized protein (UPF0261 family)
MTRNIILLASLDTKGPEAKFLHDCIEEQGIDCTLLNIGYGRPRTIDADITAAEVAAVTGADIADVRGMQDTGAASNLMMQGATIIVQKELQKGRCDGLVGFGGASNATLVSGVMQTVPVGIPKLIISSSAAMPAYASKFFGTKDVTMMNAIVDISGINTLTKSLLRRGAGAISGMVACSSGEVRSLTGKKLIAVSSFRFAEDCSQAVMRELESRGFSPIPFHAQGVGENAMEDLVGQGMFVGVIDIVPAGLSERMLGGNRAANGSRLEAAGRAGIPQVVATSGFDMISCGPISRRDSGDKLWQERKLAERAICIPDKFRVEARTTAGEVSDIAAEVARKLNRGGSPASVVVPKRGWSSLSVAGADLHDPEADAAFVPALRESLKKDCPVIEVDAELNSGEFAHVLVEHLCSLMPEPATA